uniref:PCI domain-containing protein n=1 Tax=Caenorhabditis tropicalis TaxID=1561998 RepID=A0A1I7TDZ2_9PELO
MCAEARLIGELECSLETLQDRFNTWRTPVEGQREILRAVHSALLVDQRADQAAKCFQVMTALLGTYTEKDAAAARDDAMECVRTAVVDPKSFSFDHLERLSAVKALKTSDPLMFIALELFISGTLKDYQNFVAKNPKFVTEHLKVDETILLKKIRLLTLMSLAEEKNEISLDELAKQLDIHADETLEEFVIDAIQVNAISGKINEMARTLVVSSYQHRRFGSEQWVLLEKRLKVLIANLKQTHNNVHEVNKRIDEL